MAGSSIRGHSCSRGYGHRAEARLQVAGRLHFFNDGDVKISEESPEVIFRDKIFYVALDLLFFITHYFTTQHTFQCGADM